MALDQSFFNENVRYLVWTCRNRKNFNSGDPNRVPEKHFSLILRTRFSILRPEMGP